MISKCVAPVEKFRDYVFKPGATHGKDQIFKSLGYSAENSETLAELYQRQAATKYKNGDYVIGRQDKYGQRVDIEIEIVVVIPTESGERVRRNL